MKKEFLNTAIGLRKRGYSLKEISHDLKVSKSTASLWVKDVKIGKAGLERLKNIGDLGRDRGAETNKKKRLDRLKNVAKKTVAFKDGLVDYNNERCKLLLAMLYWGEGAKAGSRLIFINSDPNMIKVYLFLLRRSFAIKEGRLKATIHLHSYHNQGEIINFWSKITKIDRENFHIFRKNNLGKRIKKDYKGCISLRYGDVNVFDEVMLIISRLHKAIK